MADRFNNRLLDNLWDHLDDIEAENDWEHTFVTGLMERAEKGQTQLTPKQFEVLNRIHDKYVMGERS